MSPLRFSLYGIMCGGCSVLQFECFRTCSYGSLRIDEYLHIACWGKYILLFVFMIRLKKCMVFRSWSLSYSCIPVLRFIGWHGFVWMSLGVICAFCVLRKTAQLCVVKFVSQCFWLLTFVSYTYFFLGWYSCVTLSLCFILYKTGCWLCDQSGMCSYSN